MFVSERERDYCTEAYSQKMVAASNHTNVAVNWAFQCLHDVIHKTRKTSETVM